MVPPAQTVTVLWDKADDFAAATLQSPEGLLMTPRRTGTDGFFVSVLKSAEAGAKLPSALRRRRHLVGAALGAALCRRGLCDAMPETSQ